MRKKGKIDVCTFHVLKKLEITQINNLPSRQQQASLCECTRASVCVCVCVFPPAVRLTLIPSLSEQLVSEHTAGCTCVRACVYVCVHALVCGINLARRTRKTIPSLLHHPRLQPPTQLHPPVDGRLREISGGPLKDTVFRGLRDEGYGLSPLVLHRERKKLMEESRGREMQVGKGR